MLDFEHASVTSHNSNDLTPIAPSISRGPTIYNMSPTDYTDIVHEEQSRVADTFLFRTFAAQMVGNFHNACFEPCVRDLLPDMKVWGATGDMTTSFITQLSWKFQENDRARGGGLVNFKIGPGTNHSASNPVSGSMYCDLIILRQGFRGMIPRSTTYIGGNHGLDI
jgi:hypothetical protein